MITDDDDTELRKFVKNNPSDVHSGINLLKVSSSASVEVLLFNSPQCHCSTSPANWRVTLVFYCHSGELAPLIAGKPVESSSTIRAEGQGLTNLAAITQQGPYWMTLLEHGSTDSGEKLKFQAKPVE